MTAQPFRTPSGGLIDRAKPLRFTFNGRAYTGFAGDTLASALLANGVRIVGRSFKYHRPRGVFGLGAEEPNALVQLGIGARTEPNSKATQVELFDGLTATSQNCWPSVDFDVGSITGLFGRMLPAGFYYKTFMLGRWIAYEPFIRRMAGLGKAPTLPDPDRYEHQHAHCDVLVVGAGPAGLAAALTAGRSGARVIIVDEGNRPGGSLLAGRVHIDKYPALDWIAETEATLRALPEVRLLTRTTAFGYYDHNQIGAVERVADHRPASGTSARDRWFLPPAHTSVRWCSATTTCLASCWPRQRAAMSIVSLPSQGARPSSLLTTIPPTPPRSTSPPAVSRCGRWLICGRAARRRWSPI
jgi:sarcosine oxidase subunit alpha